MNPEEELGERPVIELSAALPHILLGDKRSHQTPPIGGVTGSYSPARYLNNRSAHWRSVFFFVITFIYRYKDTKNILYTNKKTNIFSVKARVFFIIPKTDCFSPILIRASSVRHARKGRFFVVPFRHLYFRPHKAPVLPPVRLLPSVWYNCPSERLEASRGLILPLSVSVQSSH